jgi:uncharacterized GH25 family protein
VEHHLSRRLFDTPELFVRELSHGALFGFQISVMILKIVLPAWSSSSRTDWMRKNAALLLSLALCSLSQTGEAHDLKVFASRQTLPANGGETTIYISAGHRSPVDDLIEADAIGRYDLISPTGTKTVLEKSAGGIHANQVRLTEPGVHSVVVSKKPSVWTYVLEGETRKLKEGSKKDHSGASIDFGTHYEDFGKTLVVVGKRTDQVPGPVGLDVEIVPLDPPSSWKPGQDIRFRVIKNGKPVPIATVLARYLGSKPDDAWNYATESNRNGEFTIRPSQAGTWIIGIEFRNLTKGEIRDLYDFEANSTTLTFEVEP